MKWKALVVCLLPVLLLASHPWSKDSQSWTPQDAERILQDSPWAGATLVQFTNAEDDTRPDPGPLPGAAQAGMAGPRGASDGHWDGGVGRMNRGGTPMLNVMVRWDSAEPVRAAQRLQSSSPEASNTQPPPPLTAEQAQKEYVVSVLGLIPAKAYAATATPDVTSSSDETRDVRNPEPMLESLMHSSRLTPRDKAPIAPADAKLDSATGTVRIFFPRTREITLADREVTFTTRFGSMLVERKFRLKSMVYKGKLAL